jgi:hypothetical protein
MTNAELISELNRINDEIEALECRGRIDDAANLFKANRWIMNYDRAGNWVGPVAHENGDTG